MIRFRRKKTEITPEIIIRTIWVSSFLAGILTLPALGVFFAIYYTMGNLLMAAVIGFGLHFVTLAFAERISRRLTAIFS
jgi:hypothetical protein